MMLFCYVVLLCCHSWRVSSHSVRRLSVPTCTGSGMTYYSDDPWYTITHYIYTQHSTGRMWTDVHVHVWGMCVGVGGC
jgi:hypothetical protein